MKRMILVVFAASVVAGLGFYASRPKSQPVSTEEPTVEAAPAKLAEQVRAVQSRVGRVEEAAQPNEMRAEAAPSPAPIPASTRASAHLDAALINQAVDLLVSPQATYQQRRDAWKQLREAGKLDLAITELEQRMANDPRTAQYPTALAQAYLQKCGSIKDVREQGILAMQADKVFDTALSLDPANWEARFTKAVAMSYWPASMNKSDEVVQHFQTLLQQQESQAPQPQFAETYAWLGDQYQKAGRGDDARQVWQHGIALFPGNEKLQGKLNPSDAVK
jgi:tetratricopeptide (TPR) repeat protein